ncbi:carbohydrate ABC transporter permease [Cellulosimicrobium cellulans]|uniref:carbohydrate ABC transporter permease n=1 Tax=Cellulosimicrobium cellulans TaxID=1710 RepID=UPI00130E8914|nr:carbohydrate ABC transporter permease [Cellulosimicrobium cellulans]
MTRRTIASVARHAVLILVLLFCLVPLYWLVSTSLKETQFIKSWPPGWIPQPLTFAHYGEMFQQLPVGRWMLNSVVIAALTVVCNVVFCSMAAYVLVRKRFWGRGVIFAIVVGSMMVPPAVRLIPSYLLTQKLGLLDTYAGIVLPTAVTGFGIFLMAQFLRTLPAEVEDAARVDGCTDWGVLFRVILPMSRPALTSLAVFALVWSLDDYLWPLLVTSDTQMRPLPVGITMFVDTTIDWGPLTAVTVATILPVAILYVLFNRYFITGLTAGAVKG